MVTHCKRKTKSSFIVLCVILILTLIIQPKQSFANENEVNQTSEMINTLDKYINAEDNQFEISKIPNNVYTKFGKESINGILNGVADLNTLAQNGEIIITDNETVYETDDTSFDVQGGVNKRINTWWGRKLFMSTASAKTFVRDSTRVANGSTGIAVIAAYFSVGIGAALFGLNAAYYYNLANDVGYRNSGHSRGIILNWTWPGPYWTEKQ